MKQWQKDRNYRKYTNDDGTFTYVITVDGQDVPVNEDVYKAYSQADRRERYCAERDRGRLLSLDQMLDEGSETLMKHLAEQSIESAEEIAIKRIQEKEALLALTCLAPDERRLVQSVVMKCVTEQEYADTIGISQVAVHKRKEKILKKLFDLMVINPLGVWEGK